MARKLTDFDFAAPEKVKEDHPLAKYLDGNIWRLYPEDFLEGKDRKSTKHSIQILCTKRGFNLEFRYIGENDLVIRATKKEVF